MTSPHHPPHLTSRHDRRVLRLLILLLLAAAGPLLANRGEFADYEKALRDIRFKQWGTAAESLRQAIVDNPKEIAGPVTRPYGMHFEPYLPHFYLGLALCKLGYREESLEHWRHSDEQGVRQTVPKSEELDEKRQACELTFLPQALEDVRRSQDQARELLDRLDAEVPELRGDGSFRAEVQILRQTFEAVEHEFESLGGDSTLRGVLDMTERYRVLIENATGLQQSMIERQAERLAETLADFRQEMAETRRAAETLEAELQRDAMPLPRDLEQRIHRLVNRVMEMEGSVSSSVLEEAPLDRLQSWQQQWTTLRDSIAALSQRVDASRLPRALVDAAQALFAGEYQTALEQLRNQSFARPRSAAQAALLRAAAYHALYLISEGEDPAQLERARSEVRRGYAADPLLIPDPEVFSPRFRRFFGESLE